MATSSYQYEPSLTPLRVPDPLKGGGTLVPPPTTGATGTTLGTPLAPPPPTMVDEMFPGGIPDYRTGEPGTLTNPLPPPAPTMVDEMVPDLYPDPYAGNVDPYASIPTYQPQTLTPPQVDLSPYINQIMGQFAGGPGIIDSNLFQGLFEQGNRLLDEQYGGLQRQLEGNLASRGLDFSSVAAGNLSDIATQRGRASQELMNNLLSQEWNNMAQLRNQGVQGMLGAAGLEQGQAGQNWQNALQALNAGMAQQAQQFGQQTGERGYQDYLNQQAQQQAYQQYAMQQQAWQQAQQQYQQWVNALTAAGIDTTSLGLGAFGQGTGTALSGAQMYSDEIAQYAQSLMMMMMFAPQFFQAL